MIRGCYETQNKCFCYDNLTRNHGVGNTKPDRTLKKTHLNTFIWFAMTTVKP